MTNAWPRRLAAPLTGDHSSAQASRFLVVGVLNTAFSYAAFSFATLLGAKALLALIIANIAGVAFNFQTSRRFVFKTVRASSGVRFCLLYGVLLMVNWVAIRTLERFGLPALAAQAGLLLPLAALSYLGQRLLIFRSSDAYAPPR